MDHGTLKLITEAEIKSSLADPRFFDEMPEFLPLRTKMAAMKSDLTLKRGCTPCAQRRVYNALAGNYMQTLASLSDDGKARIRAYFGADGLRATRINPLTRAPETIRL